MRFLRYVGGLWLAALSAGIGLPLAFLALCLCVPGVALAVLAVKVWPEGSAGSLGWPQATTTTPQSFYRANGARMH